MKFKLLIHIIIISLLFTMTIGTNIVTAASNNLALNKTTYTSSNYSLSTAGAMAVNGNISLYDMWASVIGSDPHWITIDLGQGTEIGSYVVKHAGIQEEPLYNTRDFKLQYSNDNTNWTDADSVLANTSNITDRAVTPFMARYIRLYITNPTQTMNDRHARIYEFELYAPLENLALNKTVTTDSNYSSSNAGEKAVDGNDSYYSFWNSTSSSSVVHWVCVDLGQSTTIGRYIVKHAGVIDPLLITRAFVFQSSDDGVIWTDRDTPKTSNTQNSTDSTVAPFTARYIRLAITLGTQPSNPWNDWCARIYEFALYAPRHLALNKVTSISSNYSSNTTGDMAVNGNISLYNMWRSTDSSQPQWLTIDLSQSTTIGRYVIKHAGIQEDPVYNTRDFKLQYSNDNTNWTDADSVLENTANITDHLVIPFTARYIRLYITDPTQTSNDRYARIYEFELYAPNNLALNKTTYASSNYTSDTTGVKAVDGDSSLYDMWCSISSSDPQWLTIDLGQVTIIGRYVIKHAGIQEDPVYNTRDFKLKYSNDNTNWADADSVLANTDNITNRSVIPFAARYVRLYITNPTQTVNDRYARVYEIELYTPFSAVTKVACIGDSITYGGGTSDAANYSYPAILRKLLGADYVVSNYGIPGRCLLKNANYPYWNEQAYIDSSNWLPDIVIIQLGTNDSQSVNWQYESEFLSDYKDMINHYKNLSSQPTVYVCFPPTAYNTDDLVTRNAVIRDEIIPLIMQAASETNCTVIDNHTATQNMQQLFPDTVHPNNVGAVIIADKVYSALTNTTLPFNPSSYYKIVSKNSSKVMVVYGGSTDDGANIIQNSYQGDYDQQWQIVYFGEGYYQIANRNSGKVLDVSSGSTDDGAQLVQWSSNGSNSQYWQITDLGNGYFKITNRNSNKVANVYGGSTDDGAQVIQGQYTAIDYQQWSFMLAP